MIRPEKLEELQDNHHVAHAGQSADRDGEFDHDDDNVELARRQEPGREVIVVVEKKPV